MTSEDIDNVLITGGAGFIGSHVATNLLEQEIDVHIVDNTVTGREELVPSDATFDELDICSEDLNEIFERVDPDSILHLAAMHYLPVCNENPDEAFRVNVFGTRNVLSAAECLDGLESLVFASTAAVYRPETTPHHEDSVISPIDVYGETKVLGERLGELFAKRTGVSTAAARLFNVYGPKETNPHLIPVIVKQIENGSREIELGNLTPKRDFIYVDDVSRALVKILKEFSGFYRTFNVGTGHAYSVREVVECVSDAIGEEIQIQQDDSRVRESDRPHLEADVSRVKNEMDWEPRVRFTEGLQRLLEAKRK